MRAVLLSVVFLLACGGASKSADEPSAPAESAQPDSAAVDPGVEPAAEEPRVSEEAATFDPIERAIAMMEDMGKVMTAAGSDCAKMATDLAAWSNANRDERDRINEALEKSQKLEVLEKEIQERTDIMQAINSGLGSCSKHEGFVKALKQALEG